jgi:hypothetical protein
MLRRAAVVEWLMVSTRFCFGAFFVAAAERAAAVRPLAFRFVAAAAAAFGSAPGFRFVFVTRFAINPCPQHIPQRSLVAIRLRFQPIRSSVPVALVEHVQRHVFHEQIAGIAADIGTQPVS